MCFRLYLRIKIVFDILNQNKNELWSGKEYQPKVVCSGIVFVWHDIKIHNLIVHFSWSEKYRTHLIAFRLIINGIR